MRRSDRTGFSCAAIAALVLALCGCDRQSASSKAIQAAATTMQRLEAETVSGLDDPDLQRKVYREIAADLGKVASSGTERENASVSLILAQTKLGLAKDPASRAALIERQCSTLSSEIRSRRTRWVRLNTAAATDELYDPVDDLSRIRTEIADRDREIADLRAKKSEIDAEIARLRELATVKLDAAGSERAEVGGLELQASKMTARQAQPLVEEAYTRRRAADRLEVQGLGIGAEADVIVPQSDELALDIGRVAAQRSMLEDESRSVQTRSDDGRKRAAQARESAASFADEINQKVTTLSDLRRGALKEAYEEADELYASAVSLARRAQGSYRDQAGITQGKALTLLADLHTAQAQSATHAGDLLTTLAETDPPLPNADLYRNVADAFVQSRDAAIESAASRTEEATDALQRANLIEVEYEATDDPDQGYDEYADPDAAGPDAWTLVDELIDMTNSMQFQPLPDLIYPETADAIIIVDALRDVIAVLYRLDSAVQSTFDTDLMSHLQTMTGGGGMPGMSLGGDGVISRDMFTVRTEGDLAYIGSTDPSADADEQRASYIDGRWVILLGDPELDMDSAMIGSVSVYADRAIAAIDGVILQVENGELNSIDAVLVALQGTVIPIIMEAVEEFGPQLNQGPGGP